MIKINLLEVDKERKARKGPAAAPGAVPTELLAIVIILAGVLGFGFNYWTVNRQLTEITKDVEAKKKKRADLDHYIKEVDELEARRWTKAAGGLSP